MQFFPEKKNCIHFGLNFLCSHSRRRQENVSTYETVNYLFELVVFGTIFDCSVGKNKNTGQLISEIFCMKPSLNWSSTFSTKLASNVIPIVAKIRKRLTKIKMFRSARFRKNLPLENFSVQLSERLASPGIMGPP